MASLYKQIHDHIFRQQFVGKYRRTTKERVAVKLTILGGINIILAAISFYTFYRVDESRIVYGMDSISGEPNEITTNIFLKKGKTFMYIQLEYTQAYLKYSRSISFDQLKGENAPISSNISAPFAERNGKPIYPAGELPDSFFQDWIDIEGVELSQDNISYNKDDIKPTEYTASEVEIPLSWTSDTNKGTKPLNFADPRSKLPILNERFANWIYLSTFPNFKKLWGIIHAEESKFYKISIKSITDVKKQLIFTEGSWLGIKNYYMSAAFAFVGFSLLFGAYYLHLM